MQRELEALARRAAPAKWEPENDDLDDLGFPWYEIEGVDSDVVVSGQGTHGNHLDYALLRRLLP